MSPDPGFRAFLEQWVQGALRAYPAPATRPFREEPDPFRNPVGHLIATSLRQLTQELFGDFDRARVMRALEPLARLEALQAPEDGHGSRTIALARALPHSIVSLDGAARDRLDTRLATLSTLAADSAARCRSDIDAIRARAVRRRTYVADRLMAKAGPDDPDAVTGEPPAATRAPHAAAHAPLAAGCRR
jgi:hypothetical protein